MKIKSFIFNPIQENTYLIWDENTLQAAIIDAGMWNDAECKEVDNFIEQNGLKLEMLLQTHMHFDHTFGLPYLHKKYGLYPTFHIDDLKTYFDAVDMASCFRISFDQVPTSASRHLSEAEDITLGNITIKVLHTPGHTPGCVCFYIPEENILFSGDTLFQGSIGRTDFPGGNAEQEINSIKEKIAPLPDSTIVMSGHGANTKIGYEKQTNPYL